MAGLDPTLSTSHPFYDVARHGILQVAGDDRQGRRIFTFSCCRLPPLHQLNHQRLLEYLKYTLDQHVENDYTIVYFHYGLSSQNKPSLGWLQNAYKEFDRKYKKNLKALYVVHPTSLIKALWNIFKPLISATSCSSPRKWCGMTRSCETCTKARQPLPPRRRHLGRLCLPSSSASVCNTSETKIKVNSSPLCCVGR
ncbi:rCG60308, isoform CRA_a [Rattus norvegicus]|uniref:RCG60308, isoform CRA_a n=1 Tax=Rattus norvegicus TaxID=10116 RepID=A6HTC2_RAT|nr:rCG60308, isoform CRA_a [Rattus norvegicus]